MSPENASSDMMTPRWDDCLFRNSQNDFCTPVDLKGMTRAGLVKKQTDRSVNHYNVYPTHCLGKLVSKLYMFEAGWVDNVVGNLNILSQTVNWKSLRRPRCNSRSSSLN